MSIYDPHGLYFHYQTSTKKGQIIQKKVVPNVPKVYRKADYEEAERILSEYNVIIPKQLWSSFQFERSYKEEIYLRKESNFFTMASSWENSWPILFSDLWYHHNAVNFASFMYDIEHSPAFARLASVDIQFWSDYFAISKVRHDVPGDVLHSTIRIYPDPEHAFLEDDYYYPSFPSGTQVAGSYNFPFATFYSRTQTLVGERAGGYKFVEQGEPARPWALNQDVDKYYGRQNPFGIISFRYTETETPYQFLKHLQDFPTVVNLDYNPWIYGVSTDNSVEPVSLIFDTNITVVITAIYEDYPI